MHRKFCSRTYLRNLAMGIILSSLAPICAAQFEPASPPVANPADKRFVGNTEDFTTPALTTSNLKKTDILLGYVNDYETYTSQLSQVQWRWGDPIDLWLVKPKGVAKPPVILYLYSYPYDTDYFKDEAWQRAVTKDGYAAVGIVTALSGQRYHDRPMKQWFVSELQEGLATSAHDVQMVLNYLETRGDLDLSRVGVFAEGSGGSIAILASAVDPRIKVLDTVSPWGDWPTWLRESPRVPEIERPDYLTPEFLKKVATLDPLDWLPKIQAKKFRMQDEGFEPITPKVSKEKLRATVPAGSVVVVYNTMDEFNAARNHNKVMDWMHTQLEALSPAGTAVADNSCCKSQAAAGAARDK
jgi:hypothetical protein